jgi:hypothetical protein
VNQHAYHNGNRATVVLEMQGLKWATQKATIEAVLGRRPEWAIGYNAIALPIAAGVFEPGLGLVLRPEIAALSMFGSSFLVAVNALLLKRLRLPQLDEQPMSQPGR